jgi:capsule polysaccharide export protein KpsE/RkpR
MNGFQMDDSQSDTLVSELPQQADEIESADVEEAGEPLLAKIAHFLRSCWARRKMISLIVAAGILVSLAAALLEPNVYSSTTTLMPPDSSSPYYDVMGLLSPSSGAASLSSEVLGLNTPGDLFTGILESRNVQDGLIARFDLVHRYKVGFPDDARKVLTSQTKIEQDRQSGVISISVSSDDRTLSAKLAQGYVEELNRVVTDDSTSAARRERVFLEERVKEVKQDLDDSAKALSQFSTKTKAIDVSSQAKSMMDAESKLEDELMDGRSQLAALRQTYSEDNNLVKAAEARNAELQREINSTGGTPDRNGAGAATGGSVYPTVGELPALGLTYYDLERKVTVDEALWEALTKEYETAKFEEAREIPTLQVLDAAEVPRLKSGPNRKFMLIIGAMVSFVLACLLVLVLNLWEQMDPEQEPKRMLTEINDAAFNAQRWYWKLPGMKWILRRQKQSDELG